MQGDGESIGAHHFVLKARWRIKVLDDDDALDLFKKTLPSASASFVQIQSGARRAKALSLIKEAAKNSKSPQLDLIEMAINGKKIGFAKVITMIDEMVANLKVEQGDDDKKRDYCNTEFDATDDKKKGLEQSIADSETAIEELEGAIATQGGDRSSRCRHQGSGRVRC